MKCHKALWTLLLLDFGFTSCLITGQIKTLNIEILKPGIFNVPKESDLVVIKRDLYQSDTCTFLFSNGILNYKDPVNEYENYMDSNLTSNSYKNLPIMQKDTSISYKNLSDTCVMELINFFKEDGYFRKVTKASDSLNNLFKVPGKIETKEDLFEKTESDVCVFLDFLHLNTTYKDIHNSKSFPDSYFGFPFIAKASLLWTISFKTDSLVYSYIHKDTLFYDQEQIAALGKNKKDILGQLCNNSSKFLGRSFGSRMIPSWLPVERLYYRSKNLEMMKAEKFALDQDWLKAAEIWNQQTKNKNYRIAAKASFNMALACEMEGKPDVAITWLVKSYSVLPRNNEDHRAICQQYVNILALRKKEIERLEEQISD